MYVYKNLFIVKRNTINALSQRILKRYNISWYKTDPFSYSSGEDLIILAFTNKLQMLDIVDSECACVFIGNMELLYSQGIFKVAEFNTGYIQFIPFIMTTLKIMLCKFYKNPVVIWDKNIAPFIIDQAHKKGLLYNFNDHSNIIKTQPKSDPKVVPNVLPKITPKVNEETLTTPTIYLTWDRLMYLKQ